jgi:hypothetical protein
MKDELAVLRHSKKEAAYVPETVKLISLTISCSAIAVFVFC